MKCINKIAVAILTFSLAVGLTGCSFGQEAQIVDAYDTYATSGFYGLIPAETAEKNSYFASDLCVAGTENIGTNETIAASTAVAGVFNMSDETVTYSKEIFERIYPASTTKILTAYVAVKYGNLSDAVTISANAVDLPSDSSKCGILEGDVLTLEQLLYGLMLESGNDAAIAIAEHISGSVEEFANLMNAEAKALGATNSHFINPNGLHDEEHYTTVYDLYLIAQAAVKEEAFLTVLQTTSYQAVYTTAAGEPATQEWESTNQYLNGTATAPENVTVVGGKTGTTFNAGSCLVLYSLKDNEKPYISIVLRAESHDMLYQYMTDLLTNFEE